MNSRRIPCWFYNHDFWMGAFVFACALALGWGCFAPFQDRVWPPTATPMESLWFSPALGEALGWGFRVPSLDESPAAREFLELKRSHLTADDVAPLKRQLWPDHISLQHVRLFQFTGLLWRVFGISWTVMQAGLVALFALTAVIVYALFRQALGRFLSCAATLLFISAPFTLCMVSSPRDFSRAPFLLGAMLLMVLLLKEPLSIRRHARLSAILGIVVGVGFGFRHDLLICLPIGLVVLGLLARGPSLTLRWRCMAALSFLLLYQVGAGPVLGSISDKGSPTALHILTGLPATAEDDLGIGRASYERIYISSANFIDATIAGFARRAYGTAVPIDLNSPEYANVCNALLAEFFIHFPADALTFCYASGLRVMGGFAAQTQPFDIASQFPLLRAVSTFWEPLARHLDWFGPFYGILALGLLASRNWRLACSMALVVACFLFYPALEFQWRHIFHLAIAPVGALAVACGLSYITVQAIRRNGWRGAWSQSWPRIRTATGFLVCMAFLFWIPLQAARAYQGWRLNALYEEYMQLPVEPLHHEIQTLDKYEVVRMGQLGSEFVSSLPRRRVWTDEVVNLNWHLMRPKPFARHENAGNAVNPAWPESENLLMLELAPSAATRMVWLHYESNGNSGMDYSKVLYVGADGASAMGSTRYFFPVYESGDVRFAGVGVPVENAQDVRGLFRVDPDSANTLDLWLNLTLPADRRAFITHQSLFPQDPRPVDFSRGVP